MTVSVTEKTTLSGAMELRIPEPKTATPVADEYWVFETVPKVKAPKLLILISCPTVVV